MTPRHQTAPAAFLVLGLPYGVATGAVSVMLPFALTERGFPVATTASVVALAISANLWRFLWGPLADLTLTLRRWWVIGVVACAAALLTVGVVPLRLEEAGLLTAVVFGAQVAATLAVLPVSGLMAGAVPGHRQGRAAGWFQAGTLGGTGLGGGAGVWLASHQSIAVATAVLAAACAACLLALPAIGEPPPAPRPGLTARLRETGRALRELVGSRRALVVALVVASPIGVGAVSNLWGAVAPAWQAGPDTVALVSGALAGVASAGGSVAGGWAADRLGRWPAFFGAGAVLAAVGVAMAAAPRTELAFGLGGFGYALCQGAAYATFSAVVLLGAGQRLQSTRCAILISLGNLPVSYMTALDGWVHDELGPAAMLEVEAAVTAACIALGVAAVRWSRASTPARVPLAEGG